MPRYYSELLGRDTSIVVSYSVLGSIRDAVSSHGFHESYEPVIFSSSSLKTVILEVSISVEPAIQVDSPGLLWGNLNKMQYATPALQTGWKGGGNEY